MSSHFNFVPKETNPTSTKNFFTTFTEKKTEIKTYFVNNIFVNSFFRMNDIETNPWDVGKVEEFLYFCCPECDERNQSKELFLKHALDEHPKAKQCFGILRIKEEVEDDENFENKTDIDNYDNSEDYEDQDEYQCELCQKLFLEESILSKHKIIDHEILKDDQLHKCYLCNEEFAKRFEMSNHFKFVHNDTKAHRCHQCEKTFSTFTLMRDHIYCVHEGVKIHHCKICKESFGYQSALSKHMSNYHSDKDKISKTLHFKHDTDKTEEKFETKMDVDNEHKSYMHFEMPVETEILDVKVKHEYNDSLNVVEINNESYIDENSENYVERDEYQCELCQKSFLEESILSKHIIIDHEILNEGNQMHKCYLCNEEFSKRFEMANHFKFVHNETKAHKCYQCKKTFTTFTLMRDHIYCVHEGMKIHYCKICKESFGYQSALSKHMRTIHLDKHKIIKTLHYTQPKSEDSIINVEKLSNEKHVLKNEVTCKICKKSVNESILSKHVEIDHDLGNQKHVCYICNEEFLTVIKMVIHFKNVHGDNKPYKCPRCERAFSTITTLRDHIWGTHEGIKTHHCKICQQSFKVKLVDNYVQFLFKLVAILL